ncbi:hypothetical protein [Kineosporia babensis]|uniref:Uncharacterized protein n=1 Tax=Kineosporia babensis TaxID=499548 RepID=A0A9X1NC86_9ACTN|nr:hypothetical protein [Kineosporia babensis]MCD5311055.1 hypothetical protein [Kineosporia babensis]
MPGVDQDLPSGKGCPGYVARAAGPQAQSLIQVAQESFVDAWQQTMWAGTAVMVLLFVSSAFRRLERDELPTASPEPAQVTRE